MDNCSVKVLTIVLGFCLFLLAGCQGMLPSNGSLHNGVVQVVEPGVVLTFDDVNIQSWYAAEDLFNRYHAKATYFINNFDMLSTGEINMLHVLEDGGNEIACHGFRHLDAIEYCKTNSITDYISTEISPAVESMQGKGFNPTSFAYPFGANGVGDDSSKIDEALLKQFRIIRKTAFEDNMDPPAEYYYDIKKGERVTAGIDIDDSSGISIEKIMKGLQNAKEHNCVIIFYGHRILEHPESGYDTSYGRLEQIFKYVQDNGMKYYRMSDLVSN